MTLKELLGDSYSESMTLADVDKALANKKLADLSTGKYVDKDKYDKAVEKANEVQKAFDEYKEGTKDFDTLKKENETLKTEKKDNEQKALLKSLGIDEKYYKYVKSDIADGTLKLGDDEKANKTAVAEYLKTNSSFGIKQQQGVNRVVSIRNDKVDVNTDKEHQLNDTINNNIRQALGKTTNVE